MIESEMRGLKTATCKSVSGRSTLTYQLGCTPEDKVHIRLTKNSSAGEFSSEWIKIDDIRKALAKGRKGDPLTSFLLEPLLRGKSVNTPAFLMAALTQEKVLRVLKGKKRGHEFLDPEGFDARVQKLVSAKSRPKGGTSSTRKKAVAKKAPSKKTAVKKKSMSKRKTANTH